MQFTQLSTGIAGLRASVLSDSKGLALPSYYCYKAAAAAAAPEVYTVIPPQPLEKKPGQLEQWQLEQFFDKGFVQVNNFFTKEELQPVLKVRNVGRYMTMTCI